MRLKIKAYRVSYRHQSLWYDISPPVKTLAEAEKILSERGGVGYILPLYVL